MNWKAKYDQQQQALWVTFVMFIAMSLTVMREVLELRGLDARDAFSHHPFAGAPRDGSPIRGPTAPAPLHLSLAICRLQTMAHAALYLLEARTRTPFELMNAPAALADLAQAPKPAGRHLPATEPLDSS